MKTISRIEKLFAHNKAFIGYLTVGDGGLQYTLDAALALIEGGVNMIEMGMPFSDPVADGPVIQKASQRALMSGTTLQDVLWLSKEIRKRSDIPLILFSYYNPVLSAMQSNFLHDAKKAGIDGLLLVDCPLEESQLVQQQCMKNKIALIYIITPSTSLERIKKIDQYGQGFLYYACRKGTTGMRDGLPDDFEQKIKSIQSVVHLPVVVGFGVSNQHMVNHVLQFADGVVVGSLFVKALEERVSAPALSRLAKNLCPESIIAI